MKLDMSLADAQILGHVQKSFGFGFADLANAPAAEYMTPADPDSKRPFMKRRPNSMPYSNFLQGQREVI